MAVRRLVQFENPDAVRVKCLPRRGSVHTQRILVHVSLCDSESRHQFVSGLRIITRKLVRTSISNKRSRFEMSSPDSLNPGLDSSTSTNDSDGELEVSGVACLSQGSSVSLEVSEEDFRSTSSEQEFECEDPLSKKIKLSGEYKSEESQDAQPKAAPESQSCEGKANLSSVITSHEEGSQDSSQACLADTMIEPDTSLENAADIPSSEFVEQGIDDNASSDDAADSDEDDLVDYYLDTDQLEEDSSSEPEITEDILDSDSSSVPLFKDAPVSLNDCLIMILLFSIRHSLSSKCLADLLKLISSICRPLELKFKSSCYFFWKYFANLKGAIKYYYFCSECHQSLPNVDSACPLREKHINKTGVSYFIELPLAGQIQALFQQKSFVELLTHRFSRVKSQPNNLEDIYDGQLYKEQVDSGFLSSANPYNFSLLINSDGVPVYRSSKTSMWPVFFAINELPFRERFQRGNMLLGGLWYGAKKPPGNLLMGVFRQSLCDIYKGIEVKLFNSAKSVIARGKLLFATCDLPAKCMLMGMIQFNGHYGCHVCKQQGESVKIPSKKRKQKKHNDKEEEQLSKSSVWVYKYSDTEMALRNHEETVNFGVEAQKQKDANPDSKKVNVFGVTQPSALSKLMPDFIRGMAIDVMHCLFLGVVKKLALMWFSSQFSNEAFSLHEHIAVIDKKFVKICPPNFVQRKVRSIVDHMKHWKASEWRNFFFYYSLPLLDGVLPRNYLDNYYDLLISMYELHGSSISPAQILSASKRLSRFVKDFQLLYGEHHMSINIHLLLHMPLCVNNLGPLWAYSCAPFENMNGLLLKIITGTKHVQTQLANCAHLVLRLPSQLELISSPEVRQFCYELLHPSLKLKQLEVISTNLFSVGAYKLNLSLSNYLKNALKAANFIVNRSQSFLRLKMGRFLLVSEAYKRQKKTVSSYVSFYHGGIKKYGSVLSFHRISSCNCNVICMCKPAWFNALIRPIKLLPIQMGSVPTPEDTIFVHKVASQEDSGPLIAVDVSNLTSMVYFVKIGNHRYLCDPVNMLEAEL